MAASKRTPAGAVHDLPSLPAAAAALAFSPAGDELVGVAADGTIVRWDRDGQPIGEPIELGVTGHRLTIAPDGRTVAVATAGGAVIVDLATGEGRPTADEPVRPRRGGQLRARRHRPRHRWIRSGAACGTSPPVVASATRCRPRATRRSRFDATGRNLITGGDDGEVVVWEIDPDRWVELACDLAGRTLSRDEWRRYLGDRALRPGLRRDRGRIADGSVTVRTRFSRREDEMRCTARTGIGRDCRPTAGAVLVCRRGDQRHAAEPVAATDSAAPDTVATTLPAADTSCSTSGRATCRRRWLRPSDPDQRLGCDA